MHQSCPTKLQSSPSNNKTASAMLQNLITGDPILNLYFQSQKKTPEYQSGLDDFYWTLAHSLMLDGIRYRTTQNQKSVNFVENNQDMQKTVKNIESSQNYITSGPRNKHNTNDGLYGKYNGQDQQFVNPVTKKSKQKHYNVAYIKHNRFLSPSQKKQYITPKVTETIPQSPPHSKIHIYGKPRVRTDQNFGCPYHDNDQQCLQTIPYAHLPCSPPKTFLYEEQQPQNHVHEVHVRDYEVEARKSKSPPTIVPHNGYENTNPEKHGAKGSKQKNYNNREHESTVYVDNIVSVKARSPGMVRIVNSPKHSFKRKDYQYESDANQSEEYYLTAKNKDSKGKSGGNKNKKNPNEHQVESRIKFLIERDKKSKAMQKNMKKQEERIKKLQTAIEQQNRKGLKDKVKVSSRDIISLSSDSDMSLLGSDVIQKIKNKEDSARPRVKIMEQSFSDSNQQDEEDCSCSQTFNEEEEGEGQGEFQVSDQSSFGQYKPNGR